jgi:hypothetical protein
MWGGLRSIAACSGLGGGGGTLFVQRRPRPFSQDSILSRLIFIGTVNLTRALSISWEEPHMIQCRAEKTPQIWTPF